jgi:viroplasmin and RNaseH domain-containing protein
MGKGTDAKSFKFYAVSKGRLPGIYDNWSLAESQVTGYSGSTYKGFQTKLGAEKCMATAKIHNPKHYLAVDLSTAASDINWSSHSIEEQLEEPINNATNNINNTSTPIPEHGYSTKSGKRQLQSPTSTPSCSNCSKLRAVSRYWKK